MPAIVWTRPNPIERRQLLEVLEPLAATASVTIEDMLHVHINGSLTVEQLRALVTCMEQIQQGHATEPVHVVAGEPIVPQREVGGAR